MTVVIGRCPACGELGTAGHISHYSTCPTFIWGPTIYRADAAWFRRRPGFTWRSRRLLGGELYMVQLAGWPSFLTREPYAVDVTDEGGGVHQRRIWHICTGQEVAIHRDTPAP